MKHSFGVSVPLLPMLFLLFLTLKLCGVISWSWWWIMAPLWMPVVLGVVLFASCAAVIVFVYFMEKYRV